MLNGIDPVIIFQFGRQLLRAPFVVGGPNNDFNVPTKPLLYGIPIIGDNSVDFLPPIPIYLSEALTGLYVDSVDKNVDIATDIETTTDGKPVDPNQKGLASTVTINLVAKKDSIGLVLIATLVDLLFDKVTSKEYNVSFLYGATNIFRGAVQSFSINEGADNELAQIKIEITKGTKNPTAPNITPVVGGVQATIPGG